MRRTIYRIGSVINGSFNGLNVYVRDANAFVIIKNDLKGKISPGNMIYTEEQILSKSTVDRYENVSAIQKGPDPASMATGLIMFGAIGALAGAAASQSSTYDVAVYFKDGKKSLIRFYSADIYQEFLRIMF